MNWKDFIQEQLQSIIRFVITAALAFAIGYVTRNIGAEKQIKNLEWGIDYYQTQ